MIAGGVLLQAAIYLLAWRFSERQIARLQESNTELAGTLGELARVEHGVPPANWEPFEQERADAEKLWKDIYGTVPQMSFPRAELADDPTLAEDPNQLGEWDVPPGLLDAAGDEDMT